MLQIRGSGVLEGRNTTFVSLDLRCVVAAWEANGNLMAVMDGRRWPRSEVVELVPPGRPGPLNSRELLELWTAVKSAEP